MQNKMDESTDVSRPWRHFSMWFLVIILLAVLGIGYAVRAQDLGNYAFSGIPGINPADPLVDEQIEQAWHPAYLALATGDPNLISDHGVYAWPYDLDSIGWSMQSYQDYGGTPYFHHGMDMMKIYNTQVFNRSGGQVINIENYQPGWDLYWEVAILDPDGYIWQYHHIDEPTIPQYIWDKYYEYLADPVNGGFIPPDTHIGNIIYWPVWSFGKQFNHIHLNILAAGGVYVNGFEFHDPLPDMDGPEIQGVGLLQNGQIYAGDTIEGEYSLYVRSRDLILDDVYYLPPWEITFSIDCGQPETTWRFDTLPGGADDMAYLDDFYVVPPTCGDYGCRDYYIDLGFIPDSQFEFPTSGGEHTVFVTVRDYAGNEANQAYTYTVIGPPNQPPIAQPQSVSTLEDSPLDIILIGSDPNHDPLTYTIVSTPTHGALGGIAPNLVYTPTANYNGTDSLVFMVNDCLESSEQAVVDINVTPVNDAPIADPQSVTTDEDVPLEIVLSGSDPDDDPLAFTVVTSPTQGILSGVAPDLIYSPSPNYNGNDSFFFIVNDGLQSSESAEVEITITPINDPPVAEPQSISTRESIPTAITLSGMDIDGDELTYQVINFPEHGILSGTTPNLTYSPTPGYTGMDSFTFVANDGELDSMEAIISITINYGIYAPLIFK
ncbi:MAG: Ig-like domain-containing protein [Anaerolineales bacterium]